MSGLLFFNVLAAGFCIATVLFVGEHWVRNVALFFLVANIAAVLNTVGVF